MDGTIDARPKGSLTLPGGEKVTSGLEGGGWFNITAQGTRLTTTTSSVCRDPCTDSAPALSTSGKEPDAPPPKYHRESDLTTNLLRDCLLHCNEDGTRQSDSLAYDGIPQKWHEPRLAAQASLGSLRVGRWRGYNAPSGARLLTIFADYSRYQRGCIWSLAIRRRFTVA